MHAPDLSAAALRCLLASDPEEKLELTRRMAADHRSGLLSCGEVGDSPQVIERPGRPLLPNLIEPRNLPHRGLGSIEGRAALVHAVAHIEFNAINLAWDAVYRFRGMPAEFYADWVGVADDEARHFRMVSERLKQLGFRYGDFDAHNGLWEMAVRTAHSCLERMALVPRVLEARGLDVTPGMIQRLRGVGDHATADILEVILREEVAHVAAGSRWFVYCCNLENLPPEATFVELLERYMRGSVRGPFNTQARLLAGFTDAELEQLGAIAA
jgi:uncharacterized ferritin-like protein (DUF455 family)